jgi:hypothetical protein
MIKTF